MLIIWLHTGRKWGVIGSGEGFVYIWQLREPVMTSTTDTPTTQAALRMIYICNTGIIMCMRPANERRRYSVTSSLIGWVHI